MSFRVCNAYNIYYSFSSPRARVGCLYNVYVHLCTHGAKNAVHAHALAAAAAGLTTCSGFRRKSASAVFISDSSGKPAVEKVYFQSCRVHRRDGWSFARVKNRTVLRIPLVNARGWGVPAGIIVSSCVPPRQPERPTPSGAEGVSRNKSSPPASGCGRDGGKGGFDCIRWIQNAQYKDFSVYNVYIRATTIYDVEIKNKVHYEIRWGQLFFGLYNGNIETVLLDSYNIYIICISVKQERFVFVHFLIGCNGKHTTLFDIYIFCIATAG